MPTPLPSGTGDTTGDHTRIGARRGPHESPVTGDTAADTCCAVADAVRVFLTAHPEIDDTAASCCTWRCTTTRPPGATRAATDDDGASTAVVVTGRGDIDPHEAALLATAVDAALDRAEVAILVLDLTAVTFFGSRGLAVIASALRRTNRQKPALRIVAGRKVRRPTELTGLSDLIDWRDTTDDALI